MRERSSRWMFIASVFAGLSCFGCVDPEGQYDEFLERAKKTTTPQGSGCLDPDATCEPATNELAGQWLFVLSAVLAPSDPMLFFADITATDVAGGVEWTWTLRPLDAATGAPLAALPELPPSTIPADGQWTAALPTLAVPGAANPISGSDVEADTVLTGEVCGGRDFQCGDVTGAVTKLGGSPVNINLEDSTWTMARLPAPDTKPDAIFINCSCTCVAGACPDGGT
jgi:hypothetical protein